MKTATSFLALMLCTALTLHAQVVADGATSTLSNVTNNITGTLTVGTNGSFTLLTFANNALLTNSAHGVIGRNTAARSNEVQLLNATTRWQMGGSLFVGSNGAGNRLVVNGGAFVNNGSGFLGNSAASSNNFALITGSGSLWSNRLGLTVGAFGRDNLMVISNGARVVSFGGELGSQPGSSNNLVVVTGSGSVWSNRLGGWVSVGGGERGNRLIIEAGGQVDADIGVVGAGSFGGDSEALVTGPGSLWNSRTELAVGLNPSNNRLVVSNGAAVMAGGNGRLGAVTGATNNLVVVTGVGSLWSNRSELYVGEGGPRNRMEVNGGGRVVSSNSYVGYFGASNVALVTGAGSVWSNRAAMFVGHAGPGNQLVVSGGGTVITTTDSILGVNTGANSNMIVVTDPGSRWIGGINQSLYVGSNGSFNSLVISNGGSAAFGLNSFLGYGAASSNNTAFVTGSGSVWSNEYFLFVGYDGGGNRLVVSNGARVVNGAGYVGISGAGNEAMVTGLGSVLSYDGFLYLGFYSGAHSNRMVVRDGGQVTNLFAYIGLDGSSNHVVVTGPGSVWSSKSFLTVGESGSGNRMDVSASGRLVTSNASIGFGPTANGNTVVAADGGTIWTNLANLIVGESGSGSALIVSNGATVSSGNVFVGLNSASANNRVTVNGGTLRAGSADGTGVLDVRRGTNVINAGLVDVDRLVLTNTGIASLSAGNLSSNYITDAGPATPYPSTISLSSGIGNITKMTVRLDDLTCVNPDAFDILLVSPAGQKVMLMSDAGGFSPGIANVTLTFDDAAASVLPDSSPFSSGTYRPSDYGIGSPDFMPLPAPAGPYSTHLSSFNGISPNGVWSLYIAGRFGSPSGANSLLGWRLAIQTSGGVFQLNGGTLITRGAVINNALPFVVGGPGGVPAVWEARAGLSDNVVTPDLLVGNNSSFNQLVIPSGVVAAGHNVIVGAFPAASTNNLLRVTGGTLRALTPGTALDVRGGTNRIDAGLVDVNRLMVTNTRGQFEMLGGTFRSPSTTIANGRVCVIGGGTSQATYQMLGGTHTFANNLTIATNGSLIGTGLIEGTVNVAPGGSLTPGSPIGQMDVDGSVILQGTVNLQINKNGGVRTSDQVSASGGIFYAGALNVTDIGADVLSAGDRFFLFNATPYIGTFTTLNLPPLPPGLAWRNNLSVDGSIEVIALVQPKFTSISVSDTNLIFTGTNGTAGANYAVLTATNVSTPAANWLSLGTNQFGMGGQFSFTNSINPNEPQRYFRLRIL